VAGTGTNAASAASAAAANAAQANSPTGVSQMFLKILLEELSHQDPTNATDPTTMVTQLAQMTSVQETVQASEATQLQTALSLVGATVTYQSTANGSAAQGSVTGVGMGTSGPTLKIGGKDVPFGNLVSIP